MLSKRKSQRKTQAKIMMAKISKDKKEKLQKNKQLRKELGFLAKTVLIDDIMEKSPCFLDDSQPCEIEKCEVISCKELNRLRLLGVEMD